MALPTPGLALSELSSSCSPARSPTKALLRSEFHFSTQMSSRMDDAHGSQAERRGFNPWGLLCHQAHLSRLCTEYPEDKRHRILAGLPTNGWGDGGGGGEGGTETEAEETHTTWRKAAPSHSRWSMPVIPTVQEAEAGGRQV